MRRRRRPRMFGLLLLRFFVFVFFFFFAIFLTKKNRHFSSVFLTRRAPKHAMPIGDGTTVTGTTREEEEEENDDAIIKARRKSDRRRGVDWVFERASVRVGIEIRSIVGKSAISAPLSDDAKPVVVVLEGVFFENEPRRGGGERRVEQSGNGRVPVVSSVLVRGPEICKVQYVPTLFVLLKAVARPSFRRAMRNPRRVEECTRHSFSSGRTT